MYSYEKRLKAVQLYTKYDHSIADTIRELGYPSKGMLLRWYKEYQQNGVLHRGYERDPNFTLEEKKEVVDYYLEHGRNLRRTIRVMGYPSVPSLVKWIDELAPGQRKVRMTSGTMVQFSKEQKKNAVISLCTRSIFAEAVASKHGVTRGCLYKWRRQILGEQGGTSLQSSRKISLPNDKDELTTELESLKKQVYNLQMEIDILNKVSEELKKGLGIDQENLTNREKTIVIDALRSKYSLNHLLSAIGLARSSYFYQRATLSRSDKHTDLRTKVTDIFCENRMVYGYRRVHAVLQNQGIKCSEKVIRRIMHDENLIVKRKKRSKYNSYLGEISPAVPNWLERDFNAQKPNQKWVTDICEFQIPAGKVYLSPIIDCFDGMVVSWTIGTSPNAELVNTIGWRLRLSGC